MQQIAKYIPLKDGTAISVTAAGISYRHRQGSNAAWVRQVPGVTEYLDLPPDLLNSNGGKATSVRAAVKPVGWCQNPMNRGQRPPVAAEFAVGLGAGYIFTAAPPAPKPQSQSYPWIIRDATTVPQDPTAPVRIFSVRVPNGKTVRLHSFSFDLRPNVVFEENYFWRIMAAGRDLLNPYGPPLPGRPVRSAVPVAFGYDDSNLPVFPSGTLIEVVVSAQLPILATDVIAASIQGSIFG